MTQTTRREISLNCTFLNSVELGSFAVSLCDILTERGITCEHFHGISLDRYRSVRPGVPRLLSRLKQYINFPLRFLWRVKVKGYRQAICFVATTNPFYLPLIATLSGKPVIHLVYDLYPEALIFAGKTRADSLLSRFVRRVVGMAFRRSQVNVFLGERLLRAAADTHGPIPRSCIIPVGADSRPFTQPPGPVMEEGPRILYCGNYGHMHDIGTLLELVRQKGIGALTMNGTLNWQFHASGENVKYLREEMRPFMNQIGSRLTIGSPLEDGEWVTVMQKAHIALVAMIPGSERVVMPSKTYSALCAGQAILAIAPENSDLIDLIKEEGCGWWIEPGNIDGLEAVIHEIASRPKELQRRREAAYAAGHQKYSTKVLADRWYSLLLDVAEGQ